MRKPEQRLWDAFVRNSPPHVWSERIENAAGAGMPDVLVLARRGDGRAVTSFVELKAIETLPRHASTPVLGRRGLNPAQVNWHLSWHRRGGISYVLVGVGGGSRRKLHLFLGAQAAQINALPAAVFCDSQLDWTDVFEILSGGR